VFNPKYSTDATWNMFVVNPMPNSWIQKINYTDNPYNSQEIIDMAEHMKRTDPDRYKNIWLGEPLSLSEVSILGDRLEVKEFRMPDRADIHYGLDFGYAADPTALIRAGISDNVLYIDYGAQKQGLELNDMAEWIRANMTDLKAHILYCDQAQPAMISLLQSQGINAQGAKKWAGSILDGIGVLRSFEKIVVHPRCTEVIEEIKNYSWKKDKNTGEILEKPEDKWNHSIDALRYALVNVILNAHLRTEDGWASNQGDDAGWDW